MRVLVTGAGGYIGSRLVPVLLDRGHDVVATWSRRVPDRSTGGVPWWIDRVETRLMDVLDEVEVEAAVRDVDAIVYLIHAMGGADFAAHDREGATILGRAAAGAGVGRIVYLSGLVPDVPEAALSEHITSRLEVERLLGESGVPTLTARAAIVIGSGSTSFEIVRQVSERLPVQTVPVWMHSSVQPIAVVDVVEVLAGMLEVEPRTASYDVGGPERLSYAELLATYARVARLFRPQLPLLLAPRGVVGRLAGLVTAAPASTVAALVQSLPHDMVCADDRFLGELLPPGYVLLGVREAVELALTRPLAGTRPEERDPMGPLPGDAAWAGGEVYLFAGRARRRRRGGLEGLVASALLGVPVPGRGRR